MSEFSSLHSVLSQFRTNYPGGCLTTELLQVHHDNYVVRAIVQVGETIVATGMAAAMVLEQAEDRARIRALEVLGILPLPTIPQAPAPPPFRLDAEETITIVDPLGKGSATPPSMPSSTSPLEPSNPTQPRSAVSPSKPIPRPKADLEASTDETLILPQPASNSGSSTVPIDVSEIIDQTTVELKRLGWTNDQGRHHLKQHFGKESRQQLSTDELQTFLDYLKMQP